MSRSQDTQNTVAGEVAAELDAFAATLEGLHVVAFRHTRDAVCAAVELLETTANQLAGDAMDLMRELENMGGVTFEL